MKLTAFEIADALSLSHPKLNTEISDIVTDSRQVTEHTAFAALAGERCDGHDFVSELDKKFENILFLTAKPIATRNAQIVCPDVLTALADIAGMYLDTLSVCRVAVTGSVGKTTTKEILFSLLQQKYRVQKSLANRNNELGMPLTAFSVTPIHEMAVFEMGMRGLGQISYLASRVRPKVGIITNIGSSHIELLGSRENICKAKMELADHIANDGKLIVNGDEPLLRNATKTTDASVLFFGLEQEADYFAEKIVYHSDSTEFTVKTPTERFEISIPLPGEHIVYDALAAIAGAMELGVPSQDIIRCLKNYQDGGLRQNIYSRDGIVYFDDTYNAAPESVRASLNVMRSYSGRKVAVLADMLELGDYSQKAHEEVGQYAKEIGLDELICFGEFSKYTVSAFGSQNAVWCCDREQALEKLLEVAREGDMILFKGSHSMQCDKLLQDFQNRRN